MDCGFQELDSSLGCQWNLDSKFQSLVGFRIPNPRISDSTSKIFSDFGFHKQKFRGFRSGFFYTGNSREGQRLEKPFRDNCVMFYYDLVAWRSTKKIESQEKNVLS